ncbi:MAG: zinc-binding dehydrogenase [Pirellulales bacterium]|nr:zinc-binding dehydrogenase [Pirellulales bacterium]
MKTARIVAPHQLEWVDAPPPDIAELPGEPILVRLHAGVLCASDFPRYVGGAWNIEFPRPFGDSLHECIGEVVESRCPRLPVGQLVLSIPPDQRGLSEVFLADGSMTVKLPAEFTPREHLILAQPLGTVIWAARKLPNLIDQNVAVIGQGPIGLLFDHLLANMGARRVIGLDKLDYRLEFARRMRATHTINVDREDAHAAILELTDGVGADVVVEAVGHQAETLQMSVDFCRPHGTVLAFGVPDAEHYPLPIWQMIRKNQRLIGSIHPDIQRDMTLAIEMIASGRIDVSPMITHRFAFEQAAEAFDLAIARRDDPIKVLLHTSAGRDQMPVPGWKKHLPL